MISHTTESPEVEGLQPGTRVRLHSAAAGVELRSRDGYIVRPDEWLDYDVIHLDEPARYRRANGEEELLPEICESLGNFTVLP
jgi:hypothetical protein